MADQKKGHRLFIYDRKEMGVLLLLGVMVALFAFTLGVHLGKHVTPQAANEASPETHTALTQADQVPENADLAKAAEANPARVEEGLNQSLHQEVEKSGLKLDEPRQVELPSEPKAAAPKKPSVAEVAAEPAAKHDAVQEAIQRAAEEITQPEADEPQGKFTLQVGSFPTLKEAMARRNQMAKDGMKPFLRSVELKGKGVWHRVFVGGFDDKDAAEKAGQEYKAAQKISSFIVAKRPE